MNIQERTKAINEAETENKFLLLQGVINTGITTAQKYQNIFADYDMQTNKKQNKQYFEGYAAALEDIAANIKELKEHIKKQTQ